MKNSGGPSSFHLTRKRILLGSLVGPGVLGVALSLLYFLGGAVAIGPRVAFVKEWRAFLILIGVIYGFTWSCVAVVYGMFVTATRWPRLADLSNLWLSRAFLGGVTIFTALRIFLGGWTGARESYHPVTDVDDSLARGRDTVQRQRSAVVKLSDSAHELLGNLDNTERELAAAKEQVTETLTKLSRQQDEVAKANAELTALLVKQRETQLQQQEIDRDLDGRFVPTRAEMDRSTWWGWLTGALIALAINMLSAWAWERLKLRRDRSLPPQ